MKLVVTSNAAIMGGAWCIENTRIPIRTIERYRTKNRGTDWEAVRRDYPDPSYPWNKVTKNHGKQTAQV